MPTLDMQHSIIKLFTSKPGKWWTTKKIKKEIGNPPDNEFNREFLSLRETFEHEGMKIIKFKMFRSWQYVLTKNRHLIAGHNNQLKKEINRRQRRIIAI